MNIYIKIIPHSEQRYETVGDWQWCGRGHKNLKITVSSMGNWKFNVLVALHELVEVLLCKDRKISQASVDDFDMAYEARRDPSDTTSEPGDSLSAPYYKEHAFATKIERQMAKELGVEWSEYEEAVNSL